MFTILVRLITRRVSPITPSKSSLLLTARIPHFSPTVESQAAVNSPTTGFSSFIPFLLGSGHRNTHSVSPAGDLRSPVNEIEKIAKPNIEDVAPVKKSSHAKPNFVQCGKRKSGRRPKGAERRVLPKELSRNVVVLTSDNDQGGTCDVYLVGTCHDSEESCREVEAIISFLKPQVVFLELCESRAGLLTCKSVKAAGKVVPRRSEFQVAYEEAMKYGGKVVLGDRLAQVTNQRAWAKLSLWHKIKFCLSDGFEEIYRMFKVQDASDFIHQKQAINEAKEMDADKITLLMVQELSKVSPTLAEIFVNERDQYMSSELLKTARKHTSVVAVVGMAHMKGIKTHWKQPVEINKLLEVPPSVSKQKIDMAVGIAYASIAAIISIAAVHAIYPAL